MTTPFIGEIQMFGFNFSPSGWAFCDGTLMQIRQNTTLFSLLGNVYGGDGKNTFQLPDLRSQAACNQGPGPGLTPRTLGETFGFNTVTLTEAQMPAHRHVLTAFQQGDTTKRSGTPSVGGGLSQPNSNSIKPFSESPPTTPMSTSMLQPFASGGNSHSNQQPYLALNFCIALQGAFPSFG